MAAINSFRDLDVYKLALVEARQIFFLTKRFPREEMYSLTDQIRRSSRAVAAMIAAAWARRRYPNAFISKLDEALEECMETQAWLDHALQSEYIGAREHRERDEPWQRIGGKLNRMMDRADDFCRHAARERK